MCIHVQQIPQESSGSNVSLPSQEARVKGGFRTATRGRKRSPFGSHCSDAAH